MDWDGLRIFFLHIVLTKIRGPHFRRWLTSQPPDSARTLVLDVSAVALSVVGEVATWDTGRFPAAQLLEWYPLGHGHGRPGQPDSMAIEHSSFF